MKYNKVLAEFLLIDDIEQLKQLDKYLFEDSVSEVQYYIFTTEDLYKYVSNEIFSEEHDNALMELREISRKNLYSFCFVIDEDLLMDHCINNIQDILCSCSKNNFMYEETNYIIFEV